MITSTFVEILDDAWVPPGRGHRVYTSLEGENPGGSIKDHLVSGELAHWAEAGELRPGRMLCEASAGSTGKSLAYYARAHGCRCTILAPTSLPAAHLKAFEEELRRLGATLNAQPMEQVLEELRAFSDREGALCLNQMKGHFKRRHYSPLGRRILAQLGPMDALLGAVGTGHSLLGTASGMAPRPRVLSVEPVGGEVPGIRNVEQARFGAHDPVSPEEFDGRLLTAVSRAPAPLVFRTDKGPVGGGESFALVLAAASQFLQTSANQRVFLLGAGNYRTRRS